MSAVADKLREARALIERGWTQGDFFNRDSVCATGAIHKAVCGDPYTCNEDCEPLESALASVALDNSQNAGCDLVGWNDAPGRTQAEVLAAFDKAIALAEQEAVTL